MSNPWFRMYSEFATDPVMQSISFDDQRHYIMILCLKCQGVLDRKLSPENRKRIICRGLGLDFVAADEAKRRLIDVGVINSNWQPKAWKKRQYLSDSSTERSRKSRKNKETGSVAETSPATSLSVSVSVIIKEYLIEKNIDLELWRSYEKYRKSIRKVLKTDVGRKRAINELANYPKDEHEAIVNQTIEREWLSFFELQIDTNKPKVDKLRGVL